jgi:hypothetical protein
MNKHSIPPIRGQAAKTNARDLAAEAMAALEQARKVPPGPERTEALKKAGLLRNSADIRGLIIFRQAGTATKTLVSAAPKRTPGRAEIIPMDRKHGELQRESAVILSERSREIIRLYEELERKRHRRSWKAKADAEREAAIARLEKTRP